MLREIQLFINCWVWSFLAATWITWVSVCWGNWHGLMVAATKHCPTNVLLIAALIFSAGYYSAPIFLQFKEFELYWGAVFFTTRRGVLEKSLFFNQFYWSDFWRGKWNAWKNLEWFWRWTKVKSGAKREWILFMPLFRRESEKLMCEKVFSKRANFFCSCAAF